ncbi:MAG: phage tail assembly protein [Serratia proteamaculans]
MTDDQQTLSEQELPDSETLTLRKPVSLGDTKVEYHTIELKEPSLDQVDAFYRERDKTNVLNGMGLLISLVSGVPLLAVKRLGFRDYKCCEVWLTRFLTWSPARTSGAGSSPT